MARHQNSNGQRRHGFSDYKHQKIHAHHQKQEVEDSPEDLIESIVELYAGPDRDMETDEALAALQKLQVYEEQQSDSERDVITALSRHGC
jgi:hypothetical protein